MAATPKVAVALPAAAVVAVRALWLERLVPRAAEWSFPVHPTQIYESAASLAIAAFCLIYVHPRKRYDGQVFLAFVTLYATARFLIEFLRRDDRGELFGLSTSQLVGLLLVAGSIAAHRYLRAARRSKATPGAPGTVPA